MDCARDKMSDSNGGWRLEISERDAHYRLGSGELAENFLSGVPCASHRRLVRVRIGDAALFPAREAWIRAGHIFSLPSGERLDSDGVPAA